MYSIFATEVDISQYCGQCVRREELEDMYIVSIGCKMSLNFFSFFFYIWLRILERVQR